MMTHLRLAYIHRFEDRHGRVRHYFRKAGHERVALPGLPGSAAFMAAYQRALNGVPSPIAADRTAPGSMAALAASWFASAEWKRLGPATQANHRRIVDRFLAEHGSKPFGKLEARHIRGFLDAKADTPAAANRLLSILRAMLRHGVRRKLLANDPSAGVERVGYVADGFTPWADDDIARFEARWPLGTRARLALALLLYTAQRRSDVIRMGPQHVRRGAIEVTQAKTGMRLTIPIHPALREAMDAMPAAGLAAFLITEQGKAFASGNAFFNWFKSCCAAAGLAPDLSPHGLRKAAARRLAEAGCTAHEIMAVTGHVTLAEAERYTRDADRTRLAERAIAALGTGRANGG